MADSSNSRASMRRKRSRRHNPDGTMTLIEHIYEFRRRLGFALLALVAGGVVGFLWFSNRVGPIPSLGELVTVLAISYGGLLEGAVVTEVVFSWPGIGQYMTNALRIGDMNAVVAGTLIIGFIFMMLNFLSDLAYLVLDPRTREVTA